MACPETQVSTVSAASGPSSSSSPFDTPEAFQQAKAIARQESFNPEIMAMPSRIDIDEASTASDLERESMRHGLVSFFSNEDTMKAVIAEIGQNLDLSDEDSFEVAAVRRRCTARDAQPRHLPWQTYFPALFLRIHSRSILSTGSISTDETCLPRPTYSRCSRVVTLLPMPRTDWYPPCSFVRLFLV